MEGDERHVIVEQAPFAMVPEALLYDPRLNATAKVVWAALARHGTDPANCYPSHKRLAELLGMARRSVQRPLAELEAAGWIERIERLDKYGARTSDQFLVRMTCATPCATTCASETSSATPARISAGPPRESARAPRANSRGPIGTRASERDPRNEIDSAPAQTPLALVPVAQPLPALRTATFDDFYAAYPKHRSRGDAEKAWLTEVEKPGVDPELVMAGARALAAEGREAEYIPYPATWLRAKGWLDEPDPPSPPKGYDAIRRLLEGP